MFGENYKVGRMVVIREDFVRVLRPLSCQTVLFLSTQSLAEEPVSDSRCVQTSLGVRLLGTSENHVGQDQGPGGQSADCLCGP